MPHLREKSVRLVATSSHKGVPLPEADLSKFIHDSLVARIYDSKRAEVYGVPEEELGAYYAKRTLLGLLDPAGGTISVLGQPIMAYKVHQDGRHEREDSREQKRVDRDLRELGGKDAVLVMVNLPTAGVDYHVPFGGRKGSSYGPREQGRYAAEFYTTVKTAYTLA